MDIHAGLSRHWCTCVFSLGAPAVVSSPCPPLPLVALLAQRHQRRLGGLPRRLARHVPAMVHVQLPPGGPALLAGPVVALQDLQPAALPAGIPEERAVARLR